MAAPAITPTPDPKSEPASNHMPTPAPVSNPLRPAGYRAVQDFKIDRATSPNWSDAGGSHTFLPNWAGGDRQNGGGESRGTLSRVAYGPDKEVTLTTGMVSQCDRDQAGRRVR